MTKDQAKRNLRSHRGRAGDRREITQMVATGSASAAGKARHPGSVLLQHTIRNLAAPWTNRDQSVFVPLNDYIAT